MIWCSVYLAIGLLWVSVLHHSIWASPDNSEDEMDFQMIIFNMLLWPLVIVYLYREWRNRE